MKSFLVTCGLFPLLLSWCVLGMPPERYDGHKVFDVITKTPQEFKKVMELGNELKTSEKWCADYAHFISNLYRRGTPPQALVIGSNTTRKTELVYHSEQARFYFLGSHEEEDEGSCRVDFWKIPHHLNSTFHIRVEPWLQDKFTKALTDLKIPYTVLVKDVQTLIDNEVKQTPDTREKRATSVFDIYNYHSTDAIYDYLNHVASTATAARATVATIGQSAESRPLRLIKLSTSNRKRSNKPAIFIDAGIHAREWIAPATALYVLDKLAYNRDNDPEVRTLLNDFDWYILPLVNPDGYEYSRNTNRMWRKNRSHLPSNSPYYQNWMYGHCRGVDLNRNFGFHWDYRIGGSKIPCEDIYAGLGPFSEPESRSVGNFLKYHSGTIKAYLTLHSYGDLWLHPWGYTSALPTDYADLVHAANVATRALSTLHHTHYTVGSSTRVLYAAAGGSDDYAKGGAGVKYSYTVELPPKDDSVGFLLPASNIKSVGAETWMGFKAFAMELTKEYAMIGRKRLIKYN